MYDVKSSKAEEFISDEEILDTLDYAEKNKSNKELIEALLQKAASLKGLTHREAAVLLDCDLPEENEKMYRLAEQLKTISTGTVSLCSPRCICPITVSTAAPTAPTTTKQAYLPEKADPG